MFVFSERHKVVNALVPAEQTDAAHTTDIVHMENYKKCTFLVITGAAALNIPTITVLAGVDNVTCATPIVFKYRTQIAAVPPAQGSDVSTTLTDATIAGFPITTNLAGGVYIIEVDAAVVAAAGANFDHCALLMTQSGVTHAVHNYCIVAILSEPRYPQGILVTAID